MKYAIYCLLGLALVFALVSTVMTRDAIAPTEPVALNENLAPDPVACTMDAMVCPDGSYVGRSGPDCEFVCLASSTVPADVETGITAKADKIGSNPNK